MKTYTKKSISILLAAAMLAGLCMPAFAAEKKSTGIPVINVDGIATKTLYLNPGTPEEKQIFYPTSEDMTAAIKKLIFPALRLLIDRNWDAFGDKIIGLAKDLIGPIACNPDGTPKYNVAIKQEFYLPAGYNFDRNLYFSYDWRLDPIDNAKDLNDYIQYIKQQTGCEKVALIPNSMGCTVVASYLKLYGTAEVDAVVLRSSATSGVSLVGELFNKQIQISKEPVLGYINGFLKEDSQSRQIAFLLKVLDKIGVVDLMITFANNLVLNLKDRVYDEMLIETFGYLPGVWSLVPDEYYESAKTTMLDPDINAELIRKIDFYHYEVQSKIKDLMQNALNNGVQIAVVSNYNLYGCPITEKPYAQTDYLIDTEFTSGGAVCAPLKSKLPEGYTQAVDCGHNHISADRMIDASTCMFPEYTWFVKGMIHTNFNDDYMELVNWILTSDEQVNVFMNDKFPQFLQLNKVDNTLSPVLK